MRLGKTLWHIYHTEQRKQKKESTNLEVGAANSGSKLYS